MARTGGITLEDVRKAAGDIEARLGPSGVTLRRVREELGRGSLQTIQEHLRSLRSTHEVAPVDLLTGNSDEIVLSARERGVSVATWIKEAIEEKLRRERGAQLRDALAEPRSWTQPRRRALARLTKEAGTRSPESPSEDDVLSAFRAVLKGQADQAGLARRVVADGHPHDLYLVVRGERNVETLLERIVELQPASRPAAIRIGQELRLDGALLGKWLKKPYGQVVIA